MAPKGRIVTITEFLLARIAEDEKQARKHLADTVGWGDYVGRVLDECAAKRAIIESHANISKAAEERNPMMAQALVMQGMKEGTRIALASLAAVYASHPDYQQEWSL